jgi:hypothetical protein
LKERGESTRKLRRVEIPLVPTENCRFQYKNLGVAADRVKKGMICAGE